MARGGPERLGGLLSWWLALLLAATALAALAAPAAGAVDGPLQEVVRLAYRGVLGREPDPGGLRPDKNRSPLVQDLPGTFDEQGPALRQNPCHTIWKFVGHILSFVLYRHSLCPHPPGMSGQGRNSPSSR